MIGNLFAQNPRNSVRSESNNDTNAAIDWSDTSYTDYENYQRWLSQQFNESLKLYPERLDVLLKTGVRFILMGLRVCREHRWNPEKTMLADYNKLVPAFVGENESIINLDVDLFWLDTMRPVYVDNFTC